MEGSEAFQELVLARIDGWRAGLPPRLRDPLDALLRRRSYMLVDQVPDYFGPRATPLLALPMWVAECVGIGDDRAVLLDTAEASLTGYFLIRVHDDFCDEDLGDPATMMMLASALQARMLGLFGRVAPPGGGFALLVDEVFAAYGQAMLVEREALRGDGIVSVELLRATLRRYEPLLLPAGAILARANRWDLLLPIRRLVNELAEAVQLFNDVFDAEEDLARGNRTWAVCRFGAEGDPALLRYRLLGEGGLAAMVQEAVEASDRARDVALEMDLGGAVAHLEARSAAMVQARDDFFAHLLSQLLGG